MDSILDSVKRVVGVEQDDASFDVDILMHINSVFATLNQLGIGPLGGFFIEDSAAVWSNYLSDDPIFNSVKTYMGLRVRMLFDPPATSFVIESMNKQIQEFEWRLNAAREYRDHPLVTVVEVLE